MPPKYTSLLRDAIAHLQECASPVLCTKEEWAQLACTITAAPTPLPEPKKEYAPVPFKAVEKPIIKDKPTEKIKEPVREKEDPKIKSLLQRLAPGLTLIDTIPNDAKATKIMQAYKEVLSDVEIVVLACDHDHATLDLLKSLARNIDQKLTRAKVLSAGPIEQEKKWDIFLAKNPLKLLIVSEGFSKLNFAKMHYKFSNAQHFLGDVPLLILSHASTYAHSPKEKVILWNQICQILKP